MKRIMSLLLCVIMCMALAACAGKTQADTRAWSYVPLNYFVGFENKKVKVVDTDANGYTIVEVDEFGRDVKESYYESDDTLYGYTVIEWNDKNDETKWISYTEKDEVLGVWEFEYVYGKYDRKENKKEYCDGELFSETDYSFSDDKDGEYDGYRVSEWIKYSTGEFEIFSCDYNKYGEVLSRTQHTGAGPIYYEEVVEYNDDGTKKQVIKRDENGNWISTITYEIVG
ncbi:MAG: hypothetical protein IJE70_01200 [Oscillospiraceae bacterium]|nr:hypothetical protein [Oscillospiraceae bacterium]MBQ6902344.1 hypothetical protein [Oscillospiraceae bacterium]